MVDIYDKHAIFAERKRIRWEQISFRSCKMHIFIDANTHSILSALRWNNWISQAKCSSPASIRQDTRQEIGYLAIHFRFMVCKDGNEMKMTNESQTLYDMGTVAVSCCLNKVYIWLEAQCNRSNHAVVRRYTTKCTSCVYMPPRIECVQLFVGGDDFHAELRISIANKAYKIIVNKSNQ